MDITIGQVGNQTAGNPAWGGSVFTAPLITGTILHSDGSGNLASAFSMQNGTANAGYALAVQSGVVKQTANTTSTNIVIPGQSQILRMTMMVTTAWSLGNTTFGIGSSGNATYFTAAGAGNGSTLGIITLTPGATGSAIANWDNVGNTDVQITVTSGNTTGAGVGTLTVEYIPCINTAS
jgi:hypothetical protein